MRTTRIAAAMLAAACALPAGAQEDNPVPQGAGDPAIQTVVLRGVRDPDIAPYKDYYGMLSKVDKVGNGKIDLVSRIVSKESRKPLPDLEISLQGDKLSEKLAVTPDGFVTVPVNEAYLADNAVFLTNKKKGALGVEIHLVPKLPKADLTYGDIADSIAAGRRALAEILPWYVRLFVGKLNEVKLCYPDDKREIAIGNGGNGGNGTRPRPAVNEQKSMLTRDTVYCAPFTAKETEAAKETVITPPAGWVALFN